MADTDRTESQLPQDRPKYIPMYYSYLEQLGLLTLEQIGALMLALLRYGQDGTKPDFPLDSNLYMAFSFISDNSRRAELRGLEILEKRRAAGRARAASAQKDEKGRFLPSSASKIPAHSSKTSKSSYNNDNNNNNDNDNDDDDNNRRYTRARARDDGSFDDDLSEGLSEDEKEILNYCHDLIGPFTPAQDRKILAAAAGMSVDSATDAICIAYEKGARTPEYVIATLVSQRQNPDRKPGRG